MRTRFSTPAPMGDEAYIAVVGSMNVDICARPQGALIFRDSNPGTVTASPGGVGRNIAQNLCMMGAKVRLFSAIGADPNAAFLERACASCGMELSYVKRVAEGSTPTYVLVTDAEGEMELAVCDAALAAEISPAYLEKWLDVLNHAVAVVIEANLTPETLAFLGEHCRVPLFADPVSVSKCRRLLPILGRLYGMKPNRLEAEALTGIRIENSEGLRQAAEALLNTGLKQVYISLGAEGVFYADGERSFQMPCFETQLVNATGGGDTMMAALVLAYSKSLRAEEAVRLALAASAICVESSDTIPSDLSFEQVMERANMSISEEFKR